MNEVIKVHNLSKYYGEQQVFKDLTFTIKSGEVVGLLGVNGAGKTTLINILLGLQAGSTGEVQIFDENPNSLKVKEQIGVMFQDNLIIKRVRVPELLELVRTLYSKPLSQEKLQLIADLGSDTNHYVNKLSGGQQRKLNLAIALAGNPQLLFLDEPTSGMDTTSRHNFWEYMKELSTQGKTIFVTSHYLAEIEDVATRILFLKNHQLIHDGSLTSLHQKFSQNIVEFTSSLTLQQLQITTGHLIEQRGHQYQFTVDNTDDLLQELAPFMAQIHQLQIKTTSLDEIFRQINEEQ